MNMVMHVLASNYGGNRVSLFCTRFSAGVLELQTLFLKTSLNSVGVTVLNFTLLNSAHSVRVLFRENLPIFDRLDGCVVMVLVHLAVNCGLSLLVTLLDDLLIHNGGGDFLVDCGVMVTSLVPEEEW